MQPAARTAFGYLIAALSVAGITLVGSRWLHPNATTVALAFLLGVLAISAFYGLSHAVFMSIIATLAFNYFFLPPIGTLTISDPQNWVALFAFLITAVAASELSARAKRGEHFAIERQRELERLYAFSQLLLSSDNAAELLNSIPRYIVDSFGVRSAAFALSTRDDIYRSGAAIDGLESRDLQMVSLRGEPRLDSEHELAFMPLRIGMRVVGGLGVAGSHLSRQTLEAIGSLVAIAIERASSFEKLSRAEASRESEQLRSVLLDSVTHEFRSPLTSIKASATSLLGSGAHSPEERQELLTIINEESDRLNRLIGEAAEMAQLDANKVEFHFEAASLRPTVDAALDELKQLLAHHPVDVRIPSDLPQARMDASHIKEVLVHLLENAAKYSPPGSPIRVTAEAKDTTKDRMLTVSIADRGPGIDDFEQSLVFEKFYRGRNQRVSVHGTGMGLAICKAIVEAHGGSLGLTSQLGHGSVFYFSLPVA